MLSIQHYRGTYKVDYLKGLQDFVSKVKQPYETDSGQSAFKDWRRPHQSAFLRYQERIFDYHRHIRDPVNALAAGRCALEVEDYKIDRWVRFSLRFENWLRDEGLPEQREHYQQKRLRSGYYRHLAEECRREEEKFGGGVSI